MSAIVAVYNRNQSPVEISTLKLMCSAVPEHAQDGQDLWVQECVGLAHQHFWITPEEVGERQPLVDETHELAIY